MLTRRRLFAGLASLAAFGGGLFTARSAQARYYDGPISDHFDGTRFFDPHGAQPKSLFELLRWWSSGGRQPWPARVPNGPFDEPPARVEGQRLRVTFVGHAT